MAPERQLRGLLLCRQIPKNRFWQRTGLLAGRASAAYIWVALWDLSPKRSLKTQQKWDFSPKLLAIAFHQRHDAVTGWGGDGFRVWRFVFGVWAVFGWRCVRCF